MALLLETAWGDITIDLDIEGSPELLTPGRFCQAGCPVGDGTGGSSIYGLLDEDQNGDGAQNYRRSKKRFLSSNQGRPLTALEKQEKGRVVATCQAGISNTIGSQFLITLEGGNGRGLDGYFDTAETNSNKDDGNTQNDQFVSLGFVSEDPDLVLDKIASAYTDKDGRPYADIRIIRCLVVDDPFEDPPGMDELMKKKGIVVENNRVVRSPSPKRPLEEMVEERISITEVVGSEGGEADAVKLRAREKEALQKQDQGRARVLEMLGDLPDANISAPENVLFICKLNAITQDEDLELIFSRFDQSVKVEIIRDRDSGVSLQYAFAEFTRKEQAVEAYFKMNNALVDDRRIKVDFSQSVAKLWDKYRQKERMPWAGPGEMFSKEGHSRHPRGVQSSRNGTRGGRGDQGGPPRGGARGPGRDERGRGNRGRRNQDFTGNGDNGRHAQNVSHKSLHEHSRESEYQQGGRDHRNSDRKRENREERKHHEEDRRNYHRSRKEKHHRSYDEHVGDTSSSDSERRKKRKKDKKRYRESRDHARHRHREEERNNRSRESSGDRRKRRKKRSRSRS